VAASIGLAVIARARTTNCQPICAAVLRWETRTISPSGGVRLARLISGSRKPYTPQASKENNHSACGRSFPSNAPRQPFAGSAELDQHSSRCLLPHHLRAVETGPPCP